MEAFKQECSIDESLSGLEVLISGCPHPIFIISSVTQTVVTSNLKASHIGQKTHIGKHIGKVLFNYFPDGPDETVYFQNSWFTVEKKPFIFHNNDYTKVTLKELSYKPSEETLETTQNLIAMLLHRFRSPLTAIQGYSEIMSIQTSKKNQQKYLENINKGIQSISGILDEFESLLVQDDGGQQSMTTFRSLFSELMDSQPDDASRNRIRLSAPGNTAIIGCRKKLLKVLSLLTDNAISHSVDENSPVLISVKTPHSIEISNRGKAIASEDTKSVFMPFITSRADKTGVGLALAQLLAHKMGATIHLKSGEEGNIAFVLNLSPRYMAVMAG